MTTYPRNPEDIPTTPHFAILRFTSTYVAGDERSRTNPGHGYPEHYEYGTEYRSFETEAELLEQIKWMDTQGERYVVLSVRRLKVSKVVSIAIS